MTPATARVPVAAPERLPLATHVGYGLGAVATGAYGTAPSLLLLFFMTDTLGVPASLAALGLFVVKAWDVAIDPVIGTISDRTRSRWGRRRPYLMTGAVLLGLSLSLLFAVPALASANARFAWVLGMFFVTSTTFSLYSVPYIAMPAEMTDDYHERTSLMSYRMAFMSVGVLVAGGLAPLVRDLAGGGRAGYAVMSLALGAICFTFMTISVVATRRVRFTEHVERPIGVRAQWALAWANRPLVALLLVFLVQMSAIGCVIAALPYYVTYVLERGGAVFSLGFVVLTVVSILAMPLWVRVSRRVGKAVGLALSLLLFAAAALAMLPLASDLPLTWFYSITAVMGVGFAGTQLFPFAMLPDVIDHDVAQSGLRREGVFSGVWMAAEGVGMALGGLAAGAVLDGTGFVESTTGTAAQPASALVGIRVAFAVVPPLLLVLSAATLRASAAFTRPPAGRRR